MQANEIAQEIAAFAAALNPKFSNRFIEDASLAYLSHLLYPLEPTTLEVKTEPVDITADITVGVLEAVRAALKPYLNDTCDEICACDDEGYECKECKGCCDEWDSEHDFATQEANVTAAFYNRLIECGVDRQAALDLTRDFARE